MNVYCLPPHDPFCLLAETALSVQCCSNLNPCSLCALKHLWKWLWWIPSCPYPSALLTRAPLQMLCSSSQCVRLSILDKYIDTYLRLFFTLLIISKWRQWDLSLRSSNSQSFYYIVTIRVVWKGQNSVCHCYGDTTRRKVPSGECTCDHLWCNYWPKGSVSFLVLWDIVLSWPERESWDIWYSFAHILIAVI